MYPGLYDNVLVIFHFGAREKEPRRGCFIDGFRRGSCVAVEAAMCRYNVLSYSFFRCLTGASETVRRVMAHTDRSEAAATKAKATGGTHHG